MTRLKIIFRPLLSFFLLSLVPITGAQDVETEPITIDRTGFMPEGIEYDPISERFLVGSLNEGTIFGVSEAGETTPFIEDEKLVGSVGIEVDAERSRLLVANSDFQLF
jgi:hypothetical protein